MFPPPSPPTVPYGQGRAGRHLCCLDGETEAQSLLEIDEAAEKPMWGVSDWTALISGREVLP